MKEIQLKNIDNYDTVFVKHGTFHYYGLLISVQKVEKSIGVDGDVIEFTTVELYVQSKYKSLAITGKMSNYIEINNSYVNIKIASTRCVLVEKEMESKEVYILY